MSDVVASAPQAGSGPTVGTLRQRLRARLIAALARLLISLPEGPVNALADAAGEIWYRLDSVRAERARRNFRRVAQGLEARAIGSARVRAAATHDRALERIVRSAFRHFVRSYLDMARLPGQSGADLQDKLLIDTPDAVEEAFARPGPLIFVALHFGAVEYPALYAAARTGLPVTAPMETLEDPALQAWIVRSRGSVGIEFVTLREARRALTAALERGRAIGIVADRNVAGGTIDVPFFGVKAPLPMGPGLLAVEHGLPLWVAAVRRSSGGRYRGQLRRVDVPTEGTRRARLTTAMAGMTRAMEEAVAEAPEQWWAAFSPIWPDLDPEAREGSGKLEPEAAP